MVQDLTRIDLLFHFIGLQYRQCLEFLDEMTEMGINKNVIIFGKSCFVSPVSMFQCFAITVVGRLERESNQPGRK